MGRQYPSLDNVIQTSFMRAYLWSTAKLKCNDEEREREWMKLAERAGEWLDARSGNFTFNEIAAGLGISKPRQYLTRLGQVLRALGCEHVRARGKTGRSWAPPSAKFHLTGVSVITPPPLPSITRTTASQVAVMVCAENVIKTATDYEPARLAGLDQRRALEYLLDDLAIERGWRLSLAFDLDLLAGDRSRRVRGQLPRKHPLVEMPECFRSNAKPWAPAALVSFSSHLAFADHEALAAKMGLRAEVLPWSWRPDLLVVAYLRD